MRLQHCPWKAHKKAPVHVTKECTIAAGVIPWKKSELALNRHACTEAEEGGLQSLLLWGFVSPYRQHAAIVQQAKHSHWLVLISQLKQALSAALCLHSLQCLQFWMCSDRKNIKCLCVVGIYLDICSPHDAANKNVLPLNWTQTRSRRFKVSNCSKAVIDFFLQHGSNFLPSALLGFIGCSILGVKIRSITDVSFIGGVNAVLLVLPNDFSP